MVVGTAGVAARAAGGVGPKDAPARAASATAAPDHAIMTLDRTRLLRQVDAARASPVELALPLASDVHAELVRLPVTTPTTRFVVGTLGQPDRALTTFDPNEVTILHGVVREGAVPSGTMFLAFDAQRTLGLVTVGSRQYEVTSAAPPAQRDTVVLRRARTLHSPLAPGIPLCGTDTSAALTVPLSRAVAEPRRALQRLELAVDTDYELYSRFGDLDDEAFYVTALYGAISDIYVRDFNARIELTYVRLWDSPADLFNDADPLVPFQNYWENNMGAVERSAAQFLTGRRDLPYGGVAWVNSLCTSFAYSVAGLVNGSFDPSLASGSMQWDIIVAAHEFGHNCGSGHTHDYGLDDCYPPPGTETRGTIMGYCHTQNGGVANTDLRFDTYVQDIVRPNLVATGCVADDCNANNVPDADDIAGGTSADVNASGAPDECEDCDGDATLDDAEILAGAADLDGNGVPDDCQPDCNLNDLPDRWEIEQGVSDDINHNAVPDGCEPDCDSNGVADHVQIRADMHLDVDRDGVLDACADCDGDGVSDLEELDGAFELWVVGAGNQAFAYHADTGALRVATSGGTISSAEDVIISPAGTVLVASGANWRVIEFDRRTGAFIRNFVSTGSGGMRYPSGLAFGPDGNLYVASRDTDAIFKYDGATGAYLAEAILPNVGGLNDPYGLTFGPDGNLYVASSATNQVLEYDGASFAFVRAFVTAGSGGLSAPRALVFKPDGNLLVASSGNGRVLEYARDTGAFIGVFNQPFSTVGTDLDAWGLAIGPNGNVFVSRHAAEYRVLEFELATGIYLQSFVRGGHSGLDAPTGIRFAPGFATDCNRNQVPDACELLAGAADADSNGVLDECESDCDANGVYDWLEIIPRGTRLDCNFNGVLDDCEIASGHAAPGACVACGNPGDFDNDGDYDLLDAYYFTRCIGADVTVRSECACANLASGDTLIDTADWTMLEAVLSGPQ
ncbi:MAG TPA: M12 family metallo-peptidase [Phycisphaerae bacterium]|nr:M12 family metallo-peptidase [Phycisphaerae bacterium]